MGAEARCELRLGGASHEGKAFLETDELLFRADARGKEHEQDDDRRPPEPSRSHRSSLLEAEDHAPGQLELVQPALAEAEGVAEVAGVFVGEDHRLVGSATSAKASIDMGLRMGWRRVAHLESRR